MDVLSEVLRIVRFSGAIHFLGEFTQPWAFSTSPPGLMAARLKAPEGSVTPFHVCTEGGCWGALGQLPPIRIEPGDVIIFPRGDQHVMASDLRTACATFFGAGREPINDDIEARVEGCGEIPLSTGRGFHHQWEIARTDRAASNRLDRIEATKRASDLIGSLSQGKICQQACIPSRGPRPARLKAAGPLPSAERLPEGSPPS